MPTAEYADLFDIDSDANGDPILVDPVSGDTMATWDRGEGAWIPSQLGAAARPVPGTSHLESVSTDQLFTPARNAGAVVYTESGTVYADGPTGTIASGTDAGSVIDTALSSVAYVIGVGPLSFTSQFTIESPNKRVEIYGEASVDAADIKVAEVRETQHGHVEIERVDCNSQQTVAVDLHGCVESTGIVHDFVNSAGGTFTEDDGSGVGSQTYDRAVVRVKGIEGSTKTAGAYFNEAEAHTRNSTGLGRGILLTNTAGESNPQANNNVIRGGGQYQDVGIDIQDGVDNLLINPVVIGNGTGISVDTNNSFNPTYIIGTTSAEATTTPIDNQSGPVMTWGRVTGPSPKFSNDLYVWMDGTGELKFGRGDYGPVAQRFTAEGGNIGVHAVDLDLNSGNTFNLTSELGFDPIGTLTVSKSASTSATAQFALGEGFRIDEISDPANEFSTTQGTADSINVYLDGSGDYQIENSDGTAVVKGAVLVGGN